MRIDIEQQIINNFIHSNKKERFLFKISRSAHRSAILAELNDLNCFNPKCLVPLPHQVCNPAAIEERLRSYGSNTECYVMSLMHTIDGRIMSLNEALFSCVGVGVATITYCYHIRVGYYEGDQSGCYLLKNEIISRPGTKI